MTERTRRPISEAAHTVAQTLVLAAVFSVLGGLTEIRGRALGPPLRWSPHVIAGVLLFAWACSSRTFAGGLRRGLVERGRNLLLALLAWPVLAELANDGMQRKRVIVLAAVAVGFALVGAPWVARFTDALTARRKPAWGGLALGLLALVGYGLLGGGGRLESLPPEAPLTTNLLLISVDTTRADSLGCYGAERASTPAIDRLAEGGVLFEQAIAQAPHTHGSMASLLTSKYPIEHRSVAPHPQLSVRHDTLATQLWLAGYATAAFLDNPWLRPEFGFDQGYQEFTDFTPVPRIREWMEDHAEERFFLHVHFLHPHGPYEPRLPWVDRLSPDYAGPWVRVGSDVLETGEEPGAVPLSPADLQRFRALYDSEVSAMDADVGSLLSHIDDLGLAAETLVVFVADHGEEFGDHGALNHSHTLYDELIHVPLVMRLPGRLEAGQRIGQQVELVDVAPTILELLGLEVPPSARGRSLVDVLDGDPAAIEPRIAISQRYDIQQRHLLSARDGRWKLHALVTPTGPDVLLDWDLVPGDDREWTWRNRYRLYDLSEDPLERIDVIDTQPREARRLLAALVEWRELNEPTEGLGAAPGSTASDISAETLSDLRALGYLHDR